jgi:hypothetical protein
VLLDTVDGRAGHRLDGGVTVRMEPRSMLVLRVASQLGLR